MLRNASWRRSLGDLTKEAVLLKWEWSNSEVKRTMQETGRRFAGWCSIVGKSWLQDQGQVSDGRGWGEAVCAVSAVGFRGAAWGSSIPLASARKCSLLGRKQDSQHRNGEEVMGIWEERKRIPREGGWADRERVVVRPLEVQSCIDSESQQHSSASTCQPPVPEASSWTSVGLRFFICKIAIEPWFITFFWRLNETGKCPNTGYITYLTRLSAAFLYFLGDPNVGCSDDGAIETNLWFVASGNWARHSPPPSPKLSALT